jgi:hypothetical protein
VVIDNVTYQAKTLKRSQISSQWHAREVNCTLTGVTSSGGVFRFLVDSIPDTKVRVKIYKAFLSSESTQLIFDGYMQGFTIKNSEASVRFQSVSYLTKYKIPRIRYQSFCVHSLFNDNCGLKDYHYKIGGRVIDTSSDPSVEDRQIVVEGTFNDSFGESLKDKTADYFKAGMAYFNGHYRYISNSSDYSPTGSQKKLTLQMKFPSDVVGIGTLLELWPGCDKQPSTCKTQFANFNSFLGFPYIPSDQQAGDVTVVE